MIIIDLFKHVVVHVHVSILWLCLLGVHMCTSRTCNIDDHYHTVTCLQRLAANYGFTASIQSCI